MRAKETEPIKAVNRGQDPGPISTMFTVVTGFLEGAAPVMDAGKASTDVKTFE
jgi:hypothetical protein